MRILNVDFMGCIHWHYHAKDPQTSYKFLKALKEIIEQFQIDRTFLLLEGGSQYRLQLNPYYKWARKKRRAEMSDKDKRDYKRFQDEANEFVAKIAPLFAMTPLRVKGAEADDLAGFLCRHIDTNEHQILNLSGDQDWYQLLKKNVVQASYTDVQKALKEGWQIPKTIWLSAKGFEQKYEIPVSQWIWKKCLTGDAGDSVPGFPQLGEGTALALLKEYGSIEELERNAETATVPRMRKEAKFAMATNFNLVYENYKIMNLCFSDEEERAIFGSSGIATLMGAIEELGYEKTLLGDQKRQLQELCYERGWLDVDEDFLAPFL